MMNIAGLQSIEDANYRYKMPRLQAKIEGRGNGVKTVVINMKDVADALHRGPGEVTKFFGTELGAQTSYKEDTEKSIVNGQHTAPALQQLLAKYIQGFVLCPSCQLPETNYKIKGGVIYQKCDACGEKSMVDMQHKLTTFIVNSHKKAEKAAGGGKKDKKRDKDKKEKSAGGDDAASEEKKKKKKKDKDKDKEKKKKKKKDKEKEGGSKGGDSQSDDGSAADGASGGGGEKADGAGSGDEDGDDDDVPTVGNMSIEDASALESAVQRMEQFLQGNPEATPQQVLDELRMVSTLSALPVEDRMFLFVRAAFGPDCAKANAVAKHKAVLKGLILSVDAEAYQRRLIGVVEHLCSVAHPELGKWFPLLLKQLYDEDLVEEEVFLEWYEEEGPEERAASGFARREVTPAMAAALRKEAAKFINWLQESDESGSGSDDDDDSDDDDSDSD